MKSCYSVVKKVAGYTVDVLEERQDKVMENLQINKSKYLAMYKLVLKLYNVRRILVNKFLIFCM